MQLISQSRKVGAEKREWGVWPQMHWGVQHPREEPSGVVFAFLFYYNRTCLLDLKIKAEVIR